jgi:hypothetical protein
MAAWLATQGHGVNRKRVQRLMRLRHLRLHQQVLHLELFPAGAGSRFGTDSQTGLNARLAGYQRRWSAHCVSAMPKSSKLRKKADCVRGDAQEGSSMGCHLDSMS